jgi:hypothetical protein
MGNPAEKNDPQPESESIVSQSADNRQQKFCVGRKIFECEGAATHWKRCDIVCAQVISNKRIYANPAGPYILRVKETKLYAQPLHGAIEAPAESSDCAFPRGEPCPHFINWC